MPVCSPILSEFKLYTQVHSYHKVFKKNPSCNMSLPLRSCHCNDSGIKKRKSVKIF